MIESTIYQALSSDAALTALLGARNGQPAIFPDAAPEGTTGRYLTFRIMRNRGPDSALHTFIVYVDLWDYDESGKESRQASERIEYVLDNSLHTNHERYAHIRIRFESADCIDDNDPRMIHINHQFFARATRKKWIAQL